MIPTKKATIGSTVFCLALCSTTLALGAVNIELEVQGSQLVVTKNNAQCAGGDIGCIEIQPGTQPHMFFTLKGGCSSGYRLSNFRISEGYKQPPGPLNENIASDFCAEASSGYVNFSSCDNDLSESKMKIKDYNRSVVTVYYDVEAVNCSNGSDVIVLDPQIKNGGGN
jgi:hypothetical protein